MIFFFFYWVNVSHQSTSAIVKPPIKFIFGTTKPGHSLKLISVRRFTKIFIQKKEFCSVSTECDQSSEITILRGSHCMPWQAMFLYFILNTQYYLKCSLQMLSKAPESFCEKWKRIDNFVISIFSIFDVMIFFFGVNLSYKSTSAIVKPPARSHLPCYETWPSKIH